MSAPDFAHFAERHHGQVIATALISLISQRTSTRYQFAFLGGLGPRQRGIGPQGKGLAFAFVGVVEPSPLFPIGADKQIKPAAVRKAIGGRLGFGRLDGGIRLDEILCHAVTPGML